MELTSKCQEPAREISGCRVLWGKGTVNEKTLSQDHNVRPGGSRLGVRF